MAGAYGQRGEAQPGRKPTAQCAVARGVPGGLSITFRVAGETYGVGILEVAEVIMPPPLRAFPGAPPHVQGVARVRDRVVPIVCLRRRIGIPPRPPDDDTRVVIVEAGTELVGLTVDAIGEISRVPPEEVQPPPRVLAGEPVSGFLAGVATLGDRTVFVLDVSRVALAHPDRCLDAAP